MRRLAALLLVAPLLAACAKPEVQRPDPAPPPAAPVNASVTSQEPAATPGGATRAQSERERRAGPGWRYLVTGQYIIHHVVGSTAYLGTEAGDPFIRVTPGKEPAVQLLDQAPIQRDQALSPDSTRLAWVHEGRIYVREIASGQERVLTRPPEPMPPNLDRHQTWRWAGQPFWSHDGQWLYFHSNRLDPRQIQFWRVRPDGSAPEERAPEGQAYTGETDRGHIIRTVEAAVLNEILKPDGPDAYSLWPADLPISPDGRYLFHDGGRAASNLAIYDLEKPAKPVLSLSLPEELYASDNTAFTTSPWSPGSSRLLLQIRITGADLSQLVGILEKGPGGGLTLYGLDDPTMGRLQPLGWVGSHHVLVRIEQWDENLTWPVREPEIWLLDLREARPPRESASPRLAAARVSGSPIWNRDGLTQREHLLFEGGTVLLKLDRPVPASWIREQVKVEGTGAQLIATGGAAGVVTVRLEKGGPGERVQVRIPALDYSLTLLRAAPTEATVAIRQGNGPWEPLDPDRIYKDVETEVQVRFSRPVFPTGGVMPERQSAPGAAVEWETDQRLLLRLPDPPPSLHLSLDGAKDSEGFPVTIRIPTILFGPAPLLMAGSSPVDGITLPPSIDMARMAPKGDALLLDWVDGRRELRRDRLDLRTGARSGWSEEPEEAPAAYLEPGRWVYAGPDSHYETRLILTRPQPIQSAPLRSFFPPDTSVQLSPDGRRAVFWLSVDRQTGHFYLADTATGAVSRLELPDSETAWPRLWSPDSRYIILGSSLVDAATGRLLHTLEEGAVDPRFSPDGSQILYNREAWGEVAVLPIATGQAETLGTGLAVGWDSQGRPLWIDWPLAPHRTRLESYGL